jgi:predicted nucleic acid-binding protein
MDTGPLVAYLDVRDSAHTQAAEGLSSFTGHLITTSAVIVEAMFFVSAIPEGPEALANFVHAARILVHESTQPFQLKEAARLMGKYSDTPMDFADATLVLLADQLTTYEIATLDRRGFSTYRTPRGKSFRLLMDR